MRRISAPIYLCALLLVAACGHDEAASTLVDYPPYRPTPHSTPAPTPTPTPTPRPSERDEAPPLRLRLSTSFNIYATATVTSLQVPRFVYHQRSERGEYDSENVKFPIWGREGSRAFAVSAANGGNCDIDLQTASDRYVRISHDLVFKKGQSYELRDFFTESRDGGSRLTVMAKITGLAGSHNYLPPQTYGLLVCQLRGDATALRGDLRGALGEVFPSYFEFR